MTASGKKQLYGRLLRYLKPHQRRFVLSLVAMVCYGATDGFIPYLLKHILDDVFGAENKSLLYNIVLGMLGFGLFRGVAGFFQSYLPATVGLRVVADLRNDIHRQLLRLSPSQIVTFQSGALLSRMTNDTLLIRAALTDASAAFLRDTVRIIALLGVAFYLDPALALVAFIGFPLAIFPVLRFGKKVRRLSRVGQDIFGGLASILQETIQGHKVIQAFSGEAIEQQKFESENHRALEHFEKAEKYGALSGPTNEILASVAISGVILYGGLSVIGGVRTQGDFIAFITAVLLLYEPFKKMGRINYTIQTGLSAAERIFEVLDCVPSIQDPVEPKSIPWGTPRVEYRSVSFSYPQAVIPEGTSDLARAVLSSYAERGGVSKVGAQTLEDVSLSIEQGQTLALVGMSGGGKSTIVNLLPRFYDMGSGAITIGGVDIREASLSDLRGGISIVSQHTFLFNDTVQANIRYGNIHATDEQVVQAARLANAYDFIAKLPNGFYSVVGEQGMSLSGGERARIAIARAILKAAPILILDEATASLDSESEGVVSDALDRLMGGRTTIVIAHRLATIRRATKIAVLKHGAVVETGSHDELLRAAGEYAKLYALQFSHESSREAANGNG